MCLRPGWRSMAVVFCNGLRTAGSFQCQSSPCGSEGLFRVRVEQPVERYDAMTQMTQGKGYARTSTMDERSLNDAMAQRNGYLSTGWLVCDAPGASGRLVRSGREPRDSAWAVILRPFRPRPVWSARAAYSLAE